MLRPSTHLPRRRMWLTLVLGVWLIVLLGLWAGSKFSSLVISYGFGGAAGPQTGGKAPPDSIRLTVSTLGIADGEFRLSSATYPDVPAQKETGSLQPDLGWHAVFSSTRVQTMRSPLFGWKGPGEWSFLGVRLWTGPARALNVFLLTTPHWMIGAVSLIACVVTGRPVWIAYRRQRAHLCPACAYDRRGIPSDAPCPECNNPAHSETLPPSALATHHE